MYFAGSPQQVRRNSRPGSSQGACTEHLHSCSKPGAPIADAGEQVAMKACDPISLGLCATARPSLLSSYRPYRTNAPRRSLSSQLRQIAEVSRNARSVSIVGCPMPRNVHMASHPHAHIGQIASKWLNESLHGVRSAVIFGLSPATQLAELYNESPAKVEKLSQYCTR